MVNSKIIRAGGLVVLAGGYIVLERGYAINITEGGKATLGALIGEGRGSMYNTCSSDSKTLQKLTSANLADKDSSDLKYSFYSINNPKEYLGGSDAVLVEKGPYNLKKYSVAYDVAQAPSSLTDASSPDPKGTLEYSTANAYLVLDQDVTATSNTQRNSDLSLAFSGSKVTLPAAKRALASHLSMSDSVVNYSPDYLSFLGAMNDEVNMILSMQCTPEQIANIGVSGKGQCSGSQLGDISETDCACCMLDDDFALATSRATGVPPAGVTNCNSYFDDEGAILSKLSLLASYDGGVAVKAAGEKKYDGSGSDFTVTSLGQTEIHSALVQSHTINDLMFGYPSAYLGTVAYHAQLSVAEKALDSPLSSTELAKRMLTGEMDADLVFKLGNMAEYTSKVGSVCFESCLEGSDCSGKAPERQELSDADKIKLGGIECKPYTPTYKTVARCKAIDAALQLDANAPGYEACVCANGSDDWSNGPGCCLAGGMDNDGDLKGEGCLFEVAGVVDPNYAGGDGTVPNAIDLGTALQSWIAKETSSKSSEFMCPASGLELEEHKKFGHYESFGGSAAHVTYYHTGNDRIRQDDVSNTASVEHTASVTGSSGKYFFPKGLSVRAPSTQVTDGHPLNIPHPVYLPGAKKSVDFVYAGVRDRFVRNQICGTDTCIVSARMKPNSTSFDAIGAENDGAGLPFDGLQPVGHMSGPSTSGRPEYFHQPLYFDGDEVLYTQQDNLYAERAGGNGVKIYRPATDADPGAFNPSAPGSNYQLVDKAYVDSQSEVLQSHIDIEVATGLGARQRMRFGTSYSIWECDPTTNDKCKVAVNSKGGNDCYATTGSAMFNAKSSTDSDDLTTIGRNNFTYPCSAANLLTPNVVGGKVLPMYWYEESTIHMVADEVDSIAAYGETWKQHGLAHTTCMAIFMFAVALGLSMTLLCLCFEQKHAFMKSEKPATTEASEPSSA